MKIKHRREPLAVWIANYDSSDSTRFDVTLLFRKRKYYARTITAVFGLN